jgi:hypothetical protein
MNKMIATLHLNGYFRVWDANTLKMRLEINTQLLQTFTFVETSKYIIFHTKLELSFFEKFGDLEFHKSEISIKKERVNQLHYDNKLEALLLNYYYS